MDSQVGNMKINKYKWKHVWEKETEQPWQRAYKEQSEYSYCESLPFIV